MYHHNDNITSDVEDLIYDFICYRRNKRQNEIKIKNMLICDKLPKDIKIKQTDDCEEIKEFPEPICCENQKKYLDCLMCELNQKLQEIIDEVLDQYEYDGSPILDDQIDRETLSQIISKVILLSVDRIDLLKDMKPIKQQNISPNNILRALVEALVINNIFIKRKPKRRNFNKFIF